MDFFGYSEFADLPPGYFYSGSTDLDNNNRKKKSMSETKYIWVEGMAKWARLYPHNMDQKYGDKFTVSLYPNEKSKAILAEVGYRGKEREDEDGSFIKLARDNAKQFSNGMQTLGPPDVKTADGKLPFTDTIGNGSTLAILLEIFPSKYGIGSRIKEVRVLKLVEYAPPAPDDAPGLPVE